MSQSEQGEQRRHQILVFLRDYARDHGYSPSMQEIGDGIGVHKNGARHHLLKLQSEGLVEMTEGSYRSIRLTDQGHRALGDNDHEKELPKAHA